MTSDTLTLSRLHFFAHHGILPEETARGQDFEVTVHLELPLAEAGRADDLSRTVDYRVVREVVRSVMEGPPRKLVEALAEAVATEILRVFPLVQAVGVEVVKPKPPVDFVSTGLVVRIRRVRAGAA
jgi:dihydroneopterin aldolase